MTSSEDTQSWLTRAVEPTTGDDVGPVVREYRLARGMNQGAVAEAMEMTQQNLSQIEKGKRAASLEQRRAFARVLGIRWTPPGCLPVSGRRSCRTTPVRP